MPGAVEFRILRYISTRQDGGDERPTSRRSIDMLAQQFGTRVQTIDEKSTVSEPFQQPNDWNVFGVLLTLGHCQHQDHPMSQRAPKQVQLAN
jgi:hypothetical protein